MSGSDLYKTYPVRYRLLVLVAAVAVAVVLPLEYPYYLFSIAAVAVVSLIVLSSIFNPRSYYALQRDNEARRSVDIFNTFVDVLFNGGVLDEETTPELVNIEYRDPLAFYFSTCQIGKTEKQIKEAVNKSLLTFAAVSVDVEQIEANEYLITYYSVSELDRLKDCDINYSRLLELVGNEY